MDASKLPSTPEIKLHFLDYWRIIRLRKTIIFSVWLLVVLTATLVTLKAEKRYRSTARITVEKTEPYGGDIDRSSFGSGGFDPYFITTEKKRIEGTRILFQVITNLQLQKVWGKRFSDGRELTIDEAYRIMTLGVLEVDEVRNTSMLEITAKSSDPVEAAKIANEVATVYKDSRRSKHVSLSATNFASLQKKRDEQKNKVTDLQDELSKIRAELKIYDLDEGNTVTATLDPQNLLRLSMLVNEAKKEKDLLQHRLTNFTSLTPKQQRYQIPVDFKDAPLNESITQLNFWELELEQVGRELKPEHPDYQKVQKRVSQLEAQVNSGIAGVRNGIESSYLIAKAFYEGIEKELEKAKNDDIARAAKRGPYENLKAELKTAQEFLSFLNFKLATEETNAELPTESAAEIDTVARPSIEHYSPKLSLIVALSAIVGLMVGVGLAFFIEYLDTSVKTIDDVERAVQAPVLAVIPQNVGNMMDEGPESPHAEAYRVLRTNILFSRKNDSLNSITVVSGGAGEGKTTTIFNLATVFAQTGDRVLLVDSDLRRPSLHKVMGISNSVGLTNYLLKQNTLEEVIHTTNLPTLDVLPSGKLPSSSMGILSSPQMKELMQELKRRYDFVFFDSPPIMGVSDASILASMMDITLQVIQYRRYPQQMTIRAKQVIEKVGGNLIGIVLNNISMGQDDNYYYYSGYYTEYYNKEEAGEKKAKRKADKKAATEVAKVQINQKF